MSAHRIVLVDGSSGRDVLAERLRMQGYEVTVTGDPAEAAFIALADPPSAVVADLWMPTISGVQLCRLLNAEAATENVPIILRGPEQGRRHRFWAERAGAAAYVGKGRMGDLVRAISRAIDATPDAPRFTIQLKGELPEILDRIAGHLDLALFESVLAAEVRALSVCGRFDRLFDLFAQLVSQMTSYRWLAVSTVQPQRVGLHTNPAASMRCEAEARRALSLHEGFELMLVEDGDAHDDETGPDAIVAPIVFGGSVIGRVGFAPRAPLHEQDSRFVAVLARELAGPLRIAALVEESEKRATCDPLTGLLNRRALSAAMEMEVARATRHGYPFSLTLFDIDHFKHINDTFGHSMGDIVLAAVGDHVRREARKVDLVARWGGEEFVVVLSGADAEGGRVAAERIRAGLERLTLSCPLGRPIPVTASFGVAEFQAGESIEAFVDRADRAMYRSKSAGRNRVSVDGAVQQPTLVSRAG
jgi:two-component system cell cycle response regulator